MTNWERYFGTPEAAMRMEVCVSPWPLRVAVSECDPHAGCALSARRVKDFGSWGAYPDWLRAEYDDGTVWWDE